MSLLEHPAVRAVDDPDDGAAMMVAADLLEEGFWRLCDTRVPANDADHIVGVVSTSPAGFEVLWLRHGLAEATFASMDEVTAAATALVT